MLRAKSNSEFGPHPCCALSLAHLRFELQRLLPRPLTRGVTSQGFPKSLFKEHTLYTSYLESRFDLEHTHKFRIFGRSGLHSSKLT